MKRFLLILTMFISFSSFSQSSIENVIFNEINFIRSCELVENKEKKWFNIFKPDSVYLSSMNIDISSDLSEPIKLVSKKCYETILINNEEIGENIVSLFLISDYNKKIILSEYYNTVYIQVHKTKKDKQESYYVTLIFSNKT